jgi:hypothetical protein
MCIK